MKTALITGQEQAAGLPVPTLQERTESVVVTFVLPLILWGRLQSAMDD